MNSFVAWIWQGLVVAAATGVIVRAVPRLNAATRHAIWWMALALVLVHPWTPTDAAFEPLVQSVAPIEAASASMLPPLPHPPMWLAAVALGLWLCLALWRSAQIAISVRAIGRLKRQSVAFDAAAEDCLPLWRALRASGRRCALRISDHVPGPCALGFVHPAILIPRRLVGELSDTEIDQVIAHEHAHLHRYDDWLNLLQCGITAAAGIHPAVWLIDRQLDLEREAACDDRVVASTGTPSTYANCLARVAALLIAARQEPLAIAPAAIRSSVMLRARVERLLTRGWNRTLPIRWVPAGVAAVILGAVVVACDQAPPVITFAETSIAIPVAALHSSVTHTAAALTRAASTVANIAASPRGRHHAADVADPDRPTPTSLPAQAPAIGSALTVGPWPTTAAIDSAGAVQIAPPPGPPAIAVAPPAPVAGPAPSLPRAAARSGATWSTFGSSLVQAGASIGKGAGVAGQSIGKSAGGAGQSIGKNASSAAASVAHWFGRVPWTGKKKGTP